jgi:hypothetical protein
MGAMRSRLLGPLRLAGLFGAAAAFLLLDPGRVAAADPLDDAIEVVADVAARGTAPLIPITEPAVDAIETATEPLSGPAVEAAKPVTEPVVETAKPVVDDVIARSEPIVGSVPPVLAPDLPEIPDVARVPNLPATDPTSDQPAFARGSSADAERDAVSRTRPAPRPVAELGAPPAVSADATSAATRPIAAPTSTRDTASVAIGGSVLTNGGDGLAIGLAAVASIALIGGWHRLSLARLRIPSSLALAPPVPPG